MQYIYFYIFVILINNLAYLLYIKLLVKNNYQILVCNLEKYVILTSEYLCYCSLEAIKSKVLQPQAIYILVFQLIYLMAFFIGVLKCQKIKCITKITKKMLLKYY